MGAVFVFFSHSAMEYIYYEFLASGSIKVAADLQSPFEL